MAKKKSNSERKLTIQEIGSLGGKATLARYGSKYYSELSNKRESHLGGRPRKKDSV